MERSLHPSRSPAETPAPEAPAPETSAPAPSGDHYLVGDGIDPTGGAVSTAAVLAWFAALPDGATAVIRGGDVIALDATIVINRRLDLRGGGELRFVAGVEHAPALQITAAGATVSGIRLSNPEHLGAPDGGRNVGIEISAHNVTIDAVTITGFQNGVQNTPFGEYGGTIVTNCHILDVVGAGGGRGSGSEFGEDRGDGITIWGACATVVGNVVSAKPGTDARIGIHAESLGVYAAEPGPWANAMITIEGNIVTGPFRRGVAVEGMANAVVSGNSISDATWWGIGLSDTRSTSVSGNTIRWARSAADDQGSAWDPVRCPIMLYRDVQGAVVQGNLIDIRGVAAGAIVSQAALMRPADTARTGALDTIIADNVVSVTSGECPNGIMLDLAVRPIVSGNRLTVTLGSGVVGGVMSYHCVDAVITGNSVTGSAATNGFGIHHQGAAAVMIGGNLIDRIRVGITVANSTGGATIVANTVRDCELGLDTFGSTGRSVVQGNRWESKNTAHANAQPNTSYLSTRHMGSARPMGGVSGDILIGNGVLWVNDQGAWRSVKLA